MTHRRLPKLYRRTRFVIEYEDEETGCIKTFAAYAATAPIAVAITVAYIDENKLHTGQFGYGLIPRVSKTGEADFIIP
jgi:hypothetical protein